GEGVFLYNSPSAGGALADSVTFGQQLEDLSISRTADGTWRLSTPTFGAANSALPMGDPSQLKINEWLTDGVAPFSNDFIELYNPDSLPVDLGGFLITDNPNGWPDRQPIPALS